MSYDLRLGVKPEGLDRVIVIGEPELSSPTYNLGKMFRACTGWDFEQSEWYRVSNVWENINQGISELYVHPKRYKKMEPENGWGTLESAIKVLESLRDYIRSRTDEDCAGDDAIPMEYLWVKW